MSLNQGGGHMYDQLQQFELGMSRYEVQLKVHSSLWSEAFSVLQEKLNEACAFKIQFHHIGSTSVSGIRAKPILDVLGVGASVEILDDEKSAVESLGFTWKGEYGIPGRRYSVLYDPSENRSFVHLHMFVEGNPEVEKHILFREYLRAHPSAAQTYDGKKAELSERFKSQRDKYTEGKSELIQNLLNRAKVWKREGQDLL